MELEIINIGNYGQENQTSALLVGIKWLSFNVRHQSHSVKGCGILFKSSSLLPLW